MLQLISTGRSYRTIALWHRIEHQLGVELGAVAAKLFQDPDADFDSLVTEAMNLSGISPEPDTRIKWFASFYASACSPFYWHPAPPPRLPFIYLNQLPHQR